MSDVSLREFILVEEDCDICGEDQELCLGFTVEEENGDDYCEIAVSLCRACLEEQLNKYDSLVEELENEIAGPDDDLDEDLTGC